MPTDFTGEGYPRALAELFVDRGWHVLLHRFFDVLELEDTIEPKIPCRVLSVDTEHGFLHFEIEGGSETMRRVVRETIRASCSTCVVCSCEGWPVNVRGLDTVPDEWQKTVMCFDCLRAAIAVRCEVDPLDLAAFQARGWTPDEITDRPWTPEKDREDDERDGIEPDSPGIS